MCAAIVYLSKKEAKGKIGVLRNVHHGFVGRVERLSPITYFEIHQDNGVFFGAIDGHGWELQDGGTINFWPSQKLVGLQYEVQIGKNSDGTTGTQRVKKKYYGLNKYKLLDSEAADVTIPN